MQRQLTRDWQCGDKPVDVGTGVICASFGAGGQWLSLGGVHERQGFVELSAAPSFPEEQRGQPDAVRAYRRQLSETPHAFLALEHVPPGMTVSWRAETIGNRRALVQRLRLEARSGQPPSELKLRFRGRIDRPALAMITEAQPYSRPLTHGRALMAAGHRLDASAEEIEARAAISVWADGLPARWRARGGEAHLTVAWPAAARQLLLRIECELLMGGATSPDPDGVATPGDDRGSGVVTKGPIAPFELPDGLLQVPARLRPGLERIADHALAYVRGCTALRHSPGRMVILTDHRLLPLSWTRDAYYQALLLLRHGQMQTVAAHLRWLWLSCQRPHGWWARSHHADGRRKDEVYQVDQQLYPLLELADYRRALGEFPQIAGASWPELVAEVVERLLAGVSGAGLLATEENAADDPVNLPYLLANQVLAVHTFARLAALAHELGLDARAGQLAAEMRAAAKRLFVLDGPAGPLWAYAVDDTGAGVLFHDANDLPTALAPLLGFCSADEPLWRRTMDFAFSPANEAYAAGPYGGLGSRHTPGVWPLGLIQEWLARSLMGQPRRARDALARLAACACADGSLPEASDPSTGRLAARHWFAWPGALLGALLPRPGGR